MISKSIKKKLQNFGGPIATIGEVNERFRGLDGVKIETTFPDFDNKTGTIYLVYINRETKIVQIWANMENKNGQIDGAWCLRPSRIKLIDNSDKTKMLAHLNQPSIIDQVGDE